MNTTQQTNQTIKVQSMTGNDYNCPINPIKHMATIESVKRHISDTNKINILKISLYQEGTEEEISNDALIDTDAAYFVLFKDKIDLEQLQQLILTMAKDQVDDYRECPTEYITYFTYDYISDRLREEYTTDELEEAHADEDWESVIELIDYPRLIMDYFQDEYSIYERLIEGGDYTAYLTDEEIDDVEDVANSEVGAEIWHYCDY